MYYIGDVIPKIKEFGYDVSEINEYAFEYKCNMSVLKGKVIKSIHGLDKYSDLIIIETYDGDLLLMFHDQDCCENVWLEDFVYNGTIIGDSPTTFVPILVSEERTDSQDTDWGSQTYTYYTIASVFGQLDLRWLGESNGYYSEEVSTICIPKTKWRYIN